MFLGCALADDKSALFGTVWARILDVRVQTLEVLTEKIPHSQHLNVQVELWPSCCLLAAVTQGTDPLL